MLTFRFSPDFKTLDLAKARSHLSQVLETIYLSGALNHWKKTKQNHCWYFHGAHGTWREGLYSRRPCSNILHGVVVPKDHKVPGFYVIAPVSPEPSLNLLFPGSIHPTAIKTHSLGWSLSPQSPSYCYSLQPKRQALHIPQGIIGILSRVGLP